MSDKDLGPRTQGFAKGSQANRKSLLEAMRETLRTIATATNGRVHIVTVLYIYIYVYIMNSLKASSDPFINHMI